MSNNITKQLYENIYRALGGDPNAQFETAEDVWNAVTDIYDEGYDPIDLSPLDVNVTQNGTFEYTAPDNDGYNKVTVNVEVSATGGDGYDFTEYGFNDNENSLALTFLNDSLNLSKYPTNGSASFDVPKGQMIIGPKVNLINEWSPIDIYTNEYAVMYIPEIVNTNSKNMSEMFRGCRNLITPPYIISPDGGLGTSIVTHMSYMFNGCSKLRTPIYLDTSNVVDMSNMFEDCTELRSIPDDFNTSNVTNASCLFKNCQMLGTIPNNMDFRNCADMSYMFSNCGGFGYNPDTFEEIATPTVIQTSEKLLNINGMFENLWNIKYLPEMNTSGVTSAIGTFFGCSTVTEIPEYNFSSLQFADKLFNTTGISTIPQFEFNNVLSANGMFDNCDNLTSLPQLNFMNLQGSFFMNTYNYEYIGEGYTMLTDIGGFLYGHTEGANYLDLKSLTALTTDSITNVVNCIADRSSMSTGTLVFDSKLSGSITEENYSTATAKNWTIMLNEWVSPW